MAGGRIRTSRSVTVSALSVSAIRGELALILLEGIRTKL